MAIVSQLSSRRKISCLPEALHIGVCLLHPPSSSLRIELYFVGEKKRIKTKAKERIMKK